MYKDFLWKLLDNYAGQDRKHEIENRTHNIKHNSLNIMIMLSKTTLSRGY